MKEFAVDSLNKFMGIIKDEHLADSYFRGENKKYDNISSSLVRSYTSKEMNQPLSALGQKATRDYYNEIGYGLDSLQRDNFLAFSQHHGLKTNLIDFTTSPLVALYFACKNKTNDCGYVYVLLKSSTVDASDTLKSICTCDNDYHNFFSIDHLLDISNLTKYRKILDDYYSNNYNKLSVNLLNEFYAILDKRFLASKSFIELINIEENPNEQLETMKKQFIDYININTHNRIDKEKINEIADDFINMNNKNITVYCIAQYIFLTSLKNVELLYPTTQFDNNMIFPPCPYMIYKTPIKFDRIKNQSGVFIYQGFIDYSANVLQKIHGNSSYGLAVQKIIPDLTIKVNNQDEIISDLNLIGINDKYIYGDYDTTAKYINNSIFL